MITVFINDDADSELLLSLNGASFEATVRYVVEFTAHKTEKTKARPRGVSYSLVLRPLNGPLWLKFDNAHAVHRTGGQNVKKPLCMITGTARKMTKAGLSPFTTAANLLDDFWREVKRV